MKGLKLQAPRRGGSAVICIRSNYDNNAPSPGETCGYGAAFLVAGPALTGTIIEMEP